VPATIATSPAAEPADAEPLDRAILLPVVDEDAPPVIDIVPRYGVINSILPEDPEEVVPETNCKEPLTPAFPAFTVLNSINPDDDEIPEPEANAILPPVWVFAMPPNTFVFPPGSDFEKPLLKLIEPADVVLVLLKTLIIPESPELVVPDFIIKCPLTPAFPAFEEIIDILPLLLDVLFPEVIC
jgi:hypothetical protein